MEASHRHLSHRAAKRYLEGLGSVEDRPERSGPEQPPPRPGHLHTKSEFFRRPLRSRRWRRWSSTSPTGWRSASRGRWTSCPGVAPTTGCPPTPPPLSTAASASWSSTWSRSAPTPHRPSATPPATGWRARGRWRIPGDPEVWTELPRPGPPGMGARLPREELRPPATRQGDQRPGRLLPVPHFALSGAVAYDRSSRSTREGP
jgi:hypothetical protein